MVRTVCRSLRSAATKQWIGAIIMESIQVESFNLSLTYCREGHNAEVQGSAIVPALSSVVISLKSFVLFEYCRRRESEGIDSQSVGGCILITTHTTNTNKLQYCTNAK